MIDVREHLKKQYHNEPTEINYFLKEEAIKVVKGAHRTVQRNYVNDTIVAAWHNSGADIWKCLKKIWPTKFKSGKIEQINDSTNLAIMAEYLNEFFRTIGETLYANYDEDNRENTANISLNAFPFVFYFKPATYAKVQEAIKRLSASKSCGTDGLTSRLIKDAQECIVIPLLHIFNLSMKNKIFPNAWKEGTVTALYKDGRQ